MNMVNKIFSVCCFMLAFCAASHAACDISGIESDAPKLCGNAMQGGMLYGEAKGWNVYNAENAKQKISKDSVFVIGLGRDTPEIVKLMFCKEGRDNDCKTYAYKIKQRQYIEQQVTVPDKYIKYSDDVQKRIDGENAKIVKARGDSSDDSSINFMDLRPPLDMDKFPISGVFGSRRVFNGIPKSPHNGLDIAAPSGTKVRAVAPGRVVIAADMYLTGKTVFISHGHGITSAYFHLSEINVKTGANVTPDTVIGKVGATGRASGAHLHLGLYWLQIAIDPELFL